MNFSQRHNLASDYIFASGIFQLDTFKGLLKKLNMIGNLIKKLIESKSRNFHNKLGLNFYLTLCCCKCSSETSCVDPVLANR